MPNIILSDTSASVSELKKKPMATVGAGDGYPVAYFHERRSLNNFHRDRVITFEQIAE